ncbi:phage major capsid protein [Paraburkholderia sp. Cy-641]|uniref:phage major capsid protein n=1 Tax=Paraburkholderia sp. Cy-641 TaxID=2608337 RepID=UPI00196254F0|nr:phage major capsid protein [Paraburkholderia sp. Cy-641]NIF80144.1 phage major capsid protein [Paraburkholderia sp. Cy-641]
MISIQALREQRNAIAKDMRNLLDNNPDAKWKENDCQAKWDELDAKLVDIDAQITREQRMLDANAEDRFNALAGQGRDRGDRGADRTAAQDMYARWLRGGNEALSAAEWTAIRNTMSTDTPAQGGYTVQTDIAKTVIEALKAFGGMRSVSEVFTTAQGNPIEFPTSDGTGEMGEIVGQNTAANAQDPSFGAVPLPVYKYGSKIVAVPIELLQDSEVDIETFIRNRLGVRLGRITNNHFTAGDGTNKPKGLFPSLSVGVAAAAGGVSTVTYDNLVDLQESIDDAYAGTNCKWMFHQSTRKVIRKLKDTAGRPIWMPNYDDGITKGVPDQLLGADIQINNDAPVLGANNTPIAFGDFSYYKIRDVMGLTMFRFADSVYASKGQVGFLAWMRSGGVWTDVGGAAKTFQNAAA